MTIYIFFLLYSYFSKALVHSHAHQLLPLWSWECIHEKCVPFRVKNANSTLQALETCNMLCASIQIWPQPTGQVSLSTTAVPVRADLIQLRVVRAPSTIVKSYIENAFELLRNDLKVLETNERGHKNWRTVELQVSLNGSSDPQMRLTTDESYTLMLRPMKKSLIAEIVAKSFCGVRHAFETFYQLIWLDRYQGTLLIMEAAQIQDAPKFNYRGLLLDTARNYYPVKDLFRTIDAMGACKLNTLHWHASDSQAFSLQLLSVPQMSQNGALGPSAVYTPDEISAVVRRARLRGIRVIIEVDTPAHVGRAWNWGETANNKILAHCLEAEPWTAYCDEPPCGQLNPRSTRVLDILERIYTEIIQLTGVDDIFHLGGDDVSERCWQEHFNDTDPMTLWAEYTQSALRRLEVANGKLPNLTLMWTSRLSERIKTELKGYVHRLGLQSRKVAWADNHISGLRTVISHEDAWDLNSGMGAWYENNDGAPYNSWQRIYEYRPWYRNTNWRIEGGEVTMWSSTVGSGGLDARVWPRAAALAERLWTDRAEGVTRPVHARLDVARARLVARGIKAAPLWSMWCSHNPYTCA